MKKNKVVIEEVLSRIDVRDWEYKGPKRSFTYKSYWYRIVKVDGVIHFEQGRDLERCGCGKIRFPDEKVSDLYSKYMRMKFRKNLYTYYTHDFNNYHLTSNHPYDGF